MDDNNEGFYGVLTRVKEILGGNETRLPTLKRVIKYNKIAPRTPHQLETIIKCIMNIDGPTIHGVQHIDLDQFYFIRREKLINVIFGDYENSNVVCPNSPTSYGERCLLKYLIKKKHYTILRKVAQHSRVAINDNSKGGSPLTFALRHFEDSTAVKILLESNKDIRIDEIANGFDETMPDQFHHTDNLTYCRIKMSQNATKWKKIANMFIKQRIFVTPLPRKTKRMIETAQCDPSNVWSLFPVEILETIFEYCKIVFVAPRLRWRANTITCGHCQSQETIPTHECARYRDDRFGQCFDTNFCSLKCKLEHDKLYHPVTVDKCGWCDKSILCGVISHCIKCDSVVSRSSKFQFCHDPCFENHNKRFH